MAIASDGKYEPPVMRVLLSWREYDTPRMTWSRMRVRKNVTEKTILSLFLSSGCIDLKARKNVGILLTRVKISYVVTVEKN